MTDPLEEARRRGERARAILEDEVFTGAFATLEADWQRGWRQSGVADAEAREHLYRMLTALDAVRSEIQRVMADGMLAAEEVEARKRDAAIAAVAHGY